MLRMGVPGAAAALVVLLAGCTATESPTPSPTVSATLAPSGDGALRIGTVFSTTGTSAGAGAAQVAGVEVAVREINEAGGVLGAPVLVLHRDGGDESSQTLEASVVDLAARGVDVIVGPSDSALAQRAITASGAVPVIATSDIAEPATGLFTTLASGQALSTAVARALTDAPATDEAFAARVRSADPSVTDISLAAQAYDAVMLAAIAAVASDDDGAASVSATMESVSGDGIPCSSFAECADVLSTRPDIDYQGRSGPLDLDDAGRPTAGRFTVLEN